MRQTLALCALLLCAGGCGDDSNGGPDMSMPDLAPPSDMSLNGVGCGSMTCPIGQECCVTVSGTGTTTSTCIASGGNCSGGAVLACDGPEDCTSSQFCCGTITFTGGANPDAGAPMFQGGNSSCTGTCDFNINYPSTPTVVTTRLCHFDADCAGLTGFGQNLDKCCSSTMAPGLHFCATAIFGITCP
ncbi:MAG TPA: hypothetical protein VHB97_10560 [Polyangia bacterium]|nr:hypothetical protein [Polyangia bacterium]